ncbi:MAG: arginase family protein [Alphaproteobacteria bacterium]|nr:arginase family protein [Alphaproteobacteria bacterium]
MGVPQTTDLSTAKAAVIGLPFDWGQHPKRVGARLGPAAIRMMSTDMVRRFRPDDPKSLDPFEALGVVDMGDAAVPLDDVDAAMEVMTQAVSVAVDAGTVPICLGGDGMISVPSMSALAKRHPGLAVLHFDSHTDAYPEEPKDGGNEVDLNPATTFIYGAAKGYIDPTASLHFGLRGTTYVPGVYDYARQLGYQALPVEVLAELGTDRLLARFKEVLGDRPVFVCFDMDVFDPSCAPGVFTPAWGGLTAREGLTLIRGLKGLNIVGFDINTVAPLYDVQGMTAWLAATVAAEFVHLIAAEES